MKSLIPEIIEAIKLFHMDEERLKKYAEKIDIHLQIGFYNEENRRVEKMLKERYGLYEPNFNTCNFRPDVSDRDWEYNLESFQKHDREKFRCYFDITFGKNNKALVRHYEKWEFGRIWEFAFGIDFDDNRVTTFKTNNKGWFIATCDEISEIKKFLEPVWRENEENKKRI